MLNKNQTQEIIFRELRFSPLNHQLYETIKGKFLDYLKSIKSVEANKWVFFLIINNCIDIDNCDT